MPYKIPSANDYGKDSGSGDFGLLASDDYILEVDRWEERPTPIGQYNSDPNKKTIWFFMHPVGFADDPEAELVDDEGNPVHPDKGVIFFYDPDRLGLLPQIARSRKFLAAALNVPVEDEISFDGYDDLVGKQVIGSIITKNEQNRIVDIRPLKKRTRTRVAPKTTAAAAEEVFGDMIESTSESDGDY